MARAMTSCTVSTTLLPEDVPFAHRPTGRWFGMLLAQAARQFELWTGIYPEPFEQLVDFGRARDGGAF